MSENEVTKLTHWKKGTNASAFYFFSCYIQVLFESHLPSKPFAPTKLLFQFWSQEVLFQKGCQLPTIKQLRNFQRNGSGRLAVRIRNITHSGSILMLKTTCIFQPLVSSQPKLCNKLLQLSLCKCFTQSEPTEGLKWHEKKKKILEGDSFFNEQATSCSRSCKTYY